MGTSLCWNQSGEWVIGSEREPHGKTLFILGVSSHAHARDRKHCSKQHDSALLESGERRVEVCLPVVFTHLEYFTCNGEKSLGRRYSFTLIQYLQLSLDLLFCVGKISTQKQRWNELKQSYKDSSKTKTILDWGAKVTIKQTIKMDINRLL